MVTIAALDAPRGLSTLVFLLGNLFFRPQTKSARIVTLITSGIIVLLVASYGIDRLLSHHINTQVLIKAPVNHIDRPCPVPTYPIDTSITAANTKICMTTLTDSANGDLVQRMVRWRNFDQLLEMTWPNKKRYAEKHGYYLFDESASLDITRPPSWSKIKAVQRLLTEEQCEWVFWLDADTVIMNSEKRIEDFLPAAGIDLLLTGEKLNKYNAGAWVIRNTPWALEFLDTWWNMSSFVKAKGLAISGDNDALCNLLQSMDKDYFDAHIAVPERCTFNSVAAWLTEEEALNLETGKTKMEEQEWYMSTFKYHRGDLVAHVAGKDNKITTTELLLKDAV